MAKFSKLTQGKMTINGTVGSTNFELSGIDDAFLSSSADTRLITNDAVYAELQRIGYVPYGSPTELMISGALENQQYCDNPPDLRGLTFYVKYENSYHKYVPVTDSHITAGDWEDNPYTYQTTTVTYTEDGVSVSNTIGAYCLPEEIVFQSGDFNPQGTKKSELSAAILSCFKNNNVDYGGSYSILGFGFNYMRKCTSIAPDAINYNTEESTIPKFTPKILNVTGASYFPAQSSTTYNLSFSRVFGRAICNDLFARATAKGTRLRFQHIDEESGDITYSYTGIHGSVEYSCTDGPSGVIVSSKTTYSNWDSSSDWSGAVFVKIIMGEAVQINFGSVPNFNYGSTNYYAAHTCQGGIYMPLAYLTGTVTSAGLWGIDYGTDNTHVLIPISMSSIFANYGDIIESPVVNISVDAYSSMGYGIVHVSPEYPNWYAYDYNGSRVTLNPLYHYKSSHGSGIVKTIKSGTQLTYTDSEGSTTTISSNIQEVSWDDSTATVKYKDGNLNDHTVTINSDSWYRNYTLLIKANPTRTDGTTKY